MNQAEATLLSQFVRYGQKRFDLGRLLSGLVDGRPQPEIPARAELLSLVLGEVVHLPSFLQLEQETRLAPWQRWVGHRGAISDDTFGYVSDDPGIGFRHCGARCAGGVGGVGTSSGLLSARYQ